MQNEDHLKNDEQLAALAQVYLQFHLPLLAAIQAAQADLACLENAAFVAAA